MHKYMITTEQIDKVCIKFPLWNSYKTCSKPDWKNCWNQAYSCLRDWRNSASWGPNCRTPWNSLNITAAWYQGFWGGSQFGPHYAENREPLAQPIYDFFSVSAADRLWLSYGTIWRILRPSIILDARLISRVWTFKYSPVECQYILFTSGICKGKWPPEFCLNLRTRGQRNVTTLKSNTMPVPWIKEGTRYVLTLRCKRLWCLHLNLSWAHCDLSCSPKVISM